MGKLAFYEKNLSATLRETVLAHLEPDLDQQTSLLEELALMRVYASRFVSMYAAAVEAGNEAKIMLAGEGMREALESVASMCERANKVREKQKDRFSIHDVDHIVQQIVHIFHDVSRDYEGRSKHGLTNKSYIELAAIFEKAIAEGVVMPNAEVKGTLLHPDETAAKFDLTIPQTDELNDQLIDAMRETGQSLRTVLVMEQADGPS
jgi:glutamate-1-semialdehyde aminotransferase